MSLFSRIGNGIGRLWVAVAITFTAAGLLVLQGRYLQRNMRIKVEASDLLPADHPKNQEFEFIRKTFKGSSRGFFVACEAPVTRLRAVVPLAADELRALPEVDFVRWRIERDYFEDNLLLFQSVEDLRKQAEYLEEYRSDVARLIPRGGSLADFLDGLSDVIDGEQELSTPTNEAAKNTKLATDVRSLTPFLDTLRRALAERAAGAEIDPRFLDRGLEDLLLRGWFNAHDVARLDRELLLPEDVWDHAGPTMALIWIGTQRSDFDPDFSAAFMAKAESIRARLRARFPDVTFSFTGGLASYNTFATTVRSDFEQANVLGLIAVLLLLVIGFRALTPFVLLMLFLVVGTAGTLVLQNLLFGGVNMIATAVCLAVIGIGSDYGVIFLLAFQRELAAAEREPRKPTRRAWLKAVRGAIQRALATIGVSTTTGCAISAASFLALTGADVVPLVQRLLGLQRSIPKSFQPIRELGVGGALGLIYCLVLMLVALPASLYLVAWVQSHPWVRWLLRAADPFRRRLGRNHRWLIWRGRLGLTLRTDHERRWFRGLALGVVRRRFWVVGISALLFIGAVMLGRRVEWSTGQKEIEPRHSEAVEVSERVETIFGKSFENILVYGPLDVVRAFHRRLARLAGGDDTNVGEVTSIDDYLPAADEPQDQKIALAHQIDRALTEIHPSLPPTKILLSDRESRRLVAALASVARDLGALETDPVTAAAIVEARARIGLLGLALLGGRPVEPAAEWRSEWVTADAAQLGALRDRCQELADHWLDEGKPQARIRELKQIAAEIDAVRANGDGVVLGRDRAALALALAQLGLPELAAQAAADQAQAAPDPGNAAAIERVALVEPVGWLEKFVGDSSVLALRVKDSGGFVDAIARLEQVTDVLKLRTRPAAAEIGTPGDRLRASARRLGRSLQSLRSFAAANGYASVAPAMPATIAALDGLVATALALPAAHADGFVRDLDLLFAERVFDRFQALRRSASNARRPLETSDVPETARHIFSGVTADGTTLYLARVLPRVSMLQRRPFEASRKTVEGALATLAPPTARVGYSGFEVLLNLATDYLEGTFADAMIAVSLFVLLALYLLNRSVASALVILAPVVFGTVLALAFMVLVHIRITIFTVVAIPIVIGVATDSSIQVYRVYSDALRDHGHAPVPDVMAEVGKVVTLNAMSTVLPFAMLILGEMKGLIALGAVLAFGCLACFAAKILILPALISILHDYVIPATQYATLLYPDSMAVRWARALAGRWVQAVPVSDPGFSIEVKSGNVVAFTLRRPPLNLMDAGMACRATATLRAFLRDPDLSAMVCRSGLPAHYHVRDAGGILVLDERGRPKRIASSLAETEPLPPGYALEGPIRPFGAGGDLKLISSNPMNALFLLKGAIDWTLQVWYAAKPIIYVAEGDIVAGLFETAIHSNHFLVTRHARLGAPEVKRGLTVPLGAHALAIRAGTVTAQHLLTSGKIISGEDAVRLGIADGLIPDGEDPFEFAMRCLEAPGFRDRIRQISILRQYGPPLRRLLYQSTANYVRLLRDSETRRRIRTFTNAAD